MSLASFCICTSPNFTESISSTFQVAAFLLRAFMGDDLDAGLLRALQHRLGDLHVERHEADDVDLLGDQVLEQLHLLRRIDIGRADHRGVDAEIRAALLARPSRAR